MSSDLGTVKDLKGTKIVHINIRSLLPHFEEVESLLSDGRLDILVIGESWLHSRVADTLINVDNYNLFRLDRQTKLPNGSTKRGGGICIYVRNNFAVTTWPTLNISNCDLEMFSITCKAGNGRKINLHAVYRPPSGTVQNAVDQLKRNVDEVKLCTSGDNIVIGDINIVLLNRDRHANCIQQFADAYGFKQLINDPTRFSGAGSTLLDHIYTDMDYHSSSGTLNLNVSVHLPIYVVRKKERNQIKYKEIEGRSYKHFVENEFIAEFTNLDF